MSVASLRAELSAVLPTSRQPDDDTLEALLAVTAGNISAARSMALDSVGAEQRLSGHITPAPAAAAAAPPSSPPPPAAAAAATAELRRRRRSGPAQTYPAPPLRPGSGARQAGIYTNTPGPGVLTSILSKPWQLLQALLLLLSRWLPLRALLPSFCFPPPSRSGWWMGTADPALAAARYRERLQSFCDHGSFVPATTSTSSEQETASGIELTELQAAHQRPETSAAGAAALPPTGLRVPASLQSIPYEQAVARAKTEHRVLVVALESGEDNDDAATYLRTTLLNPQWDALLQQHNMLLWAGDVSAGRDAAQVSRILRVHSYPFLAFVASQPRPQPSNNGRVRLAVISRHQGLPAVELSQLRTHVEDVVLPRVGPFLASLQDEEKAKQVERQWRAEQETAYTLAAQRDSERIAAKRAEAQRNEQKQREAEAKRQAVSQSKARYVAWRSYATTALERGEVDPRGILIGGTSDPAPGTKTEFVIRLPDGSRTTVHLEPSIKAEALFVAIELASDLPEEVSGNAFNDDDLATYKPEYKFALVTDYPRRIVHPTAEVLSQPLSTSGLLGQGSNSVPRRVALILEGTTGWESEEEESEEGE